MPTIYNVIRRPLITEKALTTREVEGSLVFEVAANASKTEVKQAVETLFNVRQVCGLPPGLEEGVCPPEGRREGS
jgi:large subunit ribosomal protein L23